MNLTLRRRRSAVVPAAFLVGFASAFVPAGVASAQNCAPGFVANPYAAQCLAPVSTATINGVPCVPSNIGLCSSFVQNQQPRRAPRPVA